MPISTSLHIVRPGRTQFAYTGGYQVRDSQMSEQGNTRTYTGTIAFRDGKRISVRQVIDEVSPSSVHIEFQATPQSDMSLDGVYLSISSPLPNYAGGGAALIGAQPPATQSSRLPAAATGNIYVGGVATGVRMSGADRRWEADFAQPHRMQVSDFTDWQGRQHVEAMILLRPGDLRAGQTATSDVTITTNCDVHHEAANVTLDASQLGSPFTGIGGNCIFFLDSPVLKYNLANLNITWARVAMFLPPWEPVETPDHDPAKLDVNDTPGSDIRNSLETAQKLAARGIPIIFSVWIVPDWALRNPYPANNPYAGRRNVAPQKRDSLCRAIASYLLYAKQHYGVEAQLFSFNEPDGGTTVLLSGQQMRDFTKRLGAAFAERGLSTKVLVGDVSSPTPSRYVDPTARDSKAMSFVGAVSYHSWNGGTPAQLKAWHAAAQHMGVPLLVAEAGMDPEAYRYPFTLDDLSYSINEGALYLDMLAYSQPQSILTYELTSDYGLCNVVDGQVQPTKRFFFLKQLSDTTPVGALHADISSDNSEIHAAAFVDRATGRCVIHLVNAGPSRPVLITGIPAGVSRLRSFITDQDRSFVPQDDVVVEGAAIREIVPAMSFLTLTSH